MTSEIYLKKKTQEAKSQRLKKQLQTTYSELDREVKKGARANKKAEHSWRNLLVKLKKPHRNKTWPYSIR